ncbi:hypothetical protein CSAL01_09017 [Colletotrichum salicis]|uniref:Acyl-CoA dehydrogenase/oxidase C-terminal domain-containing protein n=1 Tax=Colletotrichum salicis TaxID=1209931 RepID=A0A135TDW4_9PEZI|nr:hypothetical protein CSAL01_09017 [Colletotrichum salicis]
MEADGSFTLNTPNAGAVKAMPPSSLLAGMARVAVVFARLIVGGDDRGVKPFVVRINDARGMCDGVVSRVPPVRAGTKPLDHSITTFYNVRLQPETLLGSASRGDNEREEFLTHIWRVSVGTLSLSIMGVSAIRAAGCIAALNSRRRLVGDRNKLPIMQFSTQQRPILEALAHGEVLHAYAKWSVGGFMNSDHNADVRRGIATFFKALVVRSSRLVHELAERCGWQGLYAHYQMSELASTFQGNSVAEGDTLVISILHLCRATYITELFQDRSESHERYIALRQLAADQLRAITEYTLRGHMGPEQELALQSEILRITANIQRMMPPLVDQEGEGRIASDQAVSSLLQVSDDTASLRVTSGERV